VGRRGSVDGEADAEDVNLADIRGSAALASSYATDIQSQLGSTVTDVTGWLSLPTSVATGLRKQYDIMHGWLTGRIGQLEVLLHMLGNADNTLGIQIALQHPWTRGTIMINSTDPFLAPSIDPHYFGVGFDTDIMAYGLDFARKLAGTAPLSTYFVTETTPGVATTGDDLYNYSRRVSTTEYHPIGTCSMLPKGDGGVVDTNLIVYGSANLRVIDASIMPLHVTAHTMASVYGIAEKGADIIKQKHMAQSAASPSGSAVATPGAANDAAVTNTPSASAASAAGGRGSSNLSSNAIIGIGVGAGVGALILLAALIAFCCIKKKRKDRQIGEKGFYAPAGAETKAGRELAFIPVALLSEITDEFSRICYERHASTSCAIQGRPHVAVALDRLDGNH
jgi:choline dehydrogenase